MVAGPPAIHRRMHERLRCGFLAASAANAGIQPEPAMPKPAETRNQSRRERELAIVGPPLSHRT